MASQTLPVSAVGTHRRSDPILTARLALDTAVETALRIATRAAVPALRYSLAVVFVWFGALKLAGRSPVAGLLAATFPFADPHLVLLVIGAAEVGLGLSLAMGWPRRLVPLALAGHLTGTFVTFLVVPGRMFTGTAPLLLSSDGEFVVKNLVLISAALTVFALGNRRAAAE